MKKTNIEELMAFLNRNTRNEEAKCLVAGLEPLLRRMAEIAESGEWPLAKEVSGERLMQLADDVAALTGKDEVMCLAISAARPFPKPDWMTEAAYQANLRNSLLANIWASLGESFWKSLKGKLERNLEVKLKEGFWVEPEEKLEVKLGESLGESLEGRLWENFKGSLWDNLGGFLWDNIFYCLGFALAGDREKTERLARMVKTYADGIMPIGFKADGPNILLILVA